MENDKHRPKLVCVIALGNPSSWFNNPSTYTSSMIIDPLFPDRKACSADSTNTIFVRQFLFLAKSVKTMVSKKSYQWWSVVYILYTNYQWKLCHYLSSWHPRILTTLHHSIEIVVWYIGRWKPEWQHVRLIHVIWYEPIRHLSMLLYL